MSLTFNYPLTHQLANSFVSLTEAEDYFANSFDIEDWSNASDDDKKRSLIKATEIINNFRFHDDKLYADQALKMPIVGHEEVTGQADSGNTTTIVDAGLIDDELYIDDYWNNGAIRIIEGTNENEVRIITDFDVSTGTITFEAMPVACDSTSQFVLIRELPRSFKYAVYELALWILQRKDKEDHDPRVQSYRIGNFSKNFFKNEGEIFLPPKVMTYLANFISKTGRIIE